LRAQLVDCNSSALKSISNLRAANTGLAGHGANSAAGPASQNEARRYEADETFNIQFHEPLQFVDEKTKELIKQIVEQIVLHMGSGHSMPAHLKDLMPASTTSAGKQASPTQELERLRRELEKSCARTEQAESRLEHVRAQLAEAQAQLARSQLTEADARADARKAEEQAREAETIMRQRVEEAEAHAQASESRARQVAEEAIAQYQEDARKESLPKKGPAARTGQNEDARFLEFKVKLKNSDGKQLGLGMDLSDGKCIGITSIDEEGLMADWNRDHSDLKVKMYDKVVKVNGACGNAQHLLDELSSDELEMTIRRRNDPFSTIEAVFGRLWQDALERMSNSVCACAICQRRAASVPEPVSPQAPTIPQTNWKSLVCMSSDGPKQHDATLETENVHPTDGGCRTISSMFVQFDLISKKDAAVQVDLVPKAIGKTMEQSKVTCVAPLLEAPRRTETRPQHSSINLGSSADVASVAAFMQEKRARRCKDSGSENTDPVRAREALTCPEPCRLLKAATSLPVLRLPAVNRQCGDIRDREGIGQPPRRLKLL